MNDDTRIDEATEPVVESRRGPSISLLPVHRPKGAPERLRSYTPSGIVAELTRLRFPGRVAEIEKDYAVETGPESEFLDHHYAEMRKIGRLVRDAGLKLLDVGNSSPRYISYIGEKLGDRGLRLANIPEWGQQSLALGSDILELFSASPVIPIDGLLGSYLPDEKKVEIYVEACKQAAEELGVNAKALTRVVRIHEYTHAITHLGKDADGQSWDTRRFKKADTDLLEALSQYYTFVASYLDEPGSLDAFSKLLGKQGTVYQAYTMFDNEGLERVRYALVQTRRMDEIATLERFYEHLSKAPLYEPSDNDEDSTKHNRPDINGVGCAAVW